MIVLLPFNERRLNCLIIIVVWSKRPRRTKSKSVHYYFLKTANPPSAVLQHFETFSHQICNFFRQSCCCCCCLLTKNIYKIFLTSLQSGEVQLLQTRRIFLPMSEGGINSYRKRKCLNRLQYFNDVLIPTWLLLKSPTSSFLFGDFFKFKCTLRVSKPHVVTRIIWHQN